MIFIVKIVDTILLMELVLCQEPFEIRSVALLDLIRFQMESPFNFQINPHRKFSAMQIRYGGCKGVISVNPELDNTPHQLRIRKSMEKFKSSHDVVELCRISKPSASHFCSIRSNVFMIFFLFQDHCI